MKIKTAEIRLPEWFQLKHYKKQLTSEEWLIEISKRVKLRDYTSNHNATRAEREEFFKKCVFEKSDCILNELLDSVHPVRGRPINPNSIFEVIYLACLVLNSEWIKVNKDWPTLQRIIAKLLSNQQLDIEDKELIEKYRAIPWHEAIPNINASFPIIEHLNGTPVTISGSFEREPTIDEFRKILNILQPKQKMRPLSVEIFKNWDRSKILAIFDLNFWFNISDTQLTNMQLYRIIWGNNGPFSKRTKEKDLPATPKVFIKLAINLSNEKISLANMKALAIYCKHKQIKEKKRQERQKSDSKA